jgi:phosphoenolpyruvate-protein kinase (PTS system EI component)
MSPSAIPVIKNLIRQMNLTSAEGVLSTVLAMGDEDRISAYLDEVLDTLDSPEKGTLQ